MSDVVLKHYVTPKFASEYWRAIEVCMREIFGTKKKQTKELIPGARRDVKTWPPAQQLDFYRDSPLKHAAIYVGNEPPYFTRDQVTAYWKIHKEKGWTI